MNRLIRPALFTVAGAAAVVAFVLAGRMSAVPLEWSNIGGWLDRADPIDALAEIARWVGLGLAVYVTAVSAAALLAEIAAVARLPRLDRALRRVVKLVAIPALRRRLLELTTAATITAAFLQTTPAGAVAAPPAPAALIMDAPTAKPIAHTLRGEFEGFGVAALAPSSLDVETHTVQPGDTLWGIIKARYGRADAELVEAVVAANSQITDPDLILVGWTIALPTTPAPVLAPATTVRGEATWTVVTVQRGDTLWDIVEAHYGHATADLVWTTVEANPTLDDPNLIYPGQQITLPAAPDTPPESTLPPQTDSDPAPPSIVAEPPVTGIEVDPSRPSDSSSVPIVVAPLPASTPPPSPASAPLTSFPDVSVPSSAPAVLAGVIAAPADDDAPSPSLARVIGWTGGAGLAAALLGLAARRRRRLPTRERHRRPSDHAVELGVALRETDNLGTVEWTAKAMRALGAGLRPRPGEPSPMPHLLRLAIDQIELVWDTPKPDVIGPWRTADGGWSWTLDRGSSLADSDGPCPCPGFVTIGRRDRADVLLNLESIGALSITGEPSDVDAVVRAVGSELAASAFADAPTVLLVGVERLAASPEHARVVDTQEALGWLRDRGDSAGALLAHRRLTSLFALRARARAQDGHEPVIVMVDPSGVSEDELNLLVNFANGDLGAIVVVIGTHPSVAWRLECANGAVDVHPLGLTLDALGLSADLDARIEEFILDDDPELDDSYEDGYEDERVDADAILADHVDAIRMREPSAADVESGPRAEGGDNEVGEWDVELKVLGQVSCVGSKEPLTPTELHLAVYLAFHRRGQCSDAIATMVWPNGAAERTITNAMASLRRKLGTGADGEMLFPLGRDSQYTYTLSPRVVTDWEQFVRITKQADEAPDHVALRLLDDALNLVDGPPFRAASGYSWGYSDGSATLIVETIKAVARRSIELHLERHELLEAGNAALRAVMASDTTGTSDPLMSRVLDALRAADDEGGVDEMLARLQLSARDT